MLYVVPQSVIIPAKNITLLLLLIRYHIKRSDFYTSCLYIQIAIIHRNLSTSGSAFANRGAHLVNIDKFRKSQTKKRKQTNEYIYAIECASHPFFTMQLNTYRFIPG